MAVSQNGWPAYESSTGLVAFPWVTGRVRPGDVYTVLNHLARRFNAEVEGIEAWQSWGWNYRAVRGAVSLSNHASGTAVDFNATRHALGARGTFTAAQVAAIRRILAALGGVVRWGGDYTARADEMHFEINAGPGRVAEIARTLGGLVSNPIGGGATVNVPTIPGRPAPIEEDDDMRQDERDWLYRCAQILEALDPQRARLKEAADRVMGVLPDKRMPDQSVATVLTTAEGQILRDDIAASTSRAVAETSAAFHQLVARIDGKTTGAVDVTALAAALKTTLGAAVADELANRLKD